MSTIQLREPTLADADACGRVIFRAFQTFQQGHNFPLDFPATEVAIGLAREFIEHPQIYGVVAEQDGRVVACNFLDERDPIRGVGPMTVDPEFQSRGLGRQLMQAVLDRGRGAAGVRLVQEAFNTTSMSLYASLGFEVREPLVLMTGKCRSKPEAGALAHPVQTEDLAQCDALCRRVHGYDRGGVLRACMKSTRPYALSRGGRITAYAAAPTFFIFNYGVAETEQDLQSLLLATSAAVDPPLSLLVPTRRTGLFRWLLSEGLRIAKPMTLMSVGDYREPVGGFYPSVLY